MDMGAALLNTLLATGLTFLCTTIGSAAVFFMKPRRAPDDAGPRLAETLSLGFAAGIMVAAAVWSLLIPGMEAAESALDIDSLVQEAVDGVERIWIDIEG